MSGASSGVPSRGESAEGIRVGVCSSVLAGVAWKSGPAEAWSSVDASMACQAAEGQRLSPCGNRLQPLRHTIFSAACFGQGCSQNRPRALFSPSSQLCLDPLCPESTFAAPFPQTPHPRYDD